MPTPEKTRRRLACASCGSEGIYVPGECYVRCFYEDDEGLGYDGSDVIKAEPDGNEWTYYCAACGKQVEVKDADA